MTKQKEGRKVAAVLAAGGALCAGSPARADLSWEHTGTLRISTIKQPVFKLKMYNSWTASSHRVLFKYGVYGPASGMMKKMSPHAMETFAPLSNWMPQGPMPLDLPRMLLAQAVEQVIAEEKPVKSAKTKADDAESKLPTVDKVSNFGALSFVQRAEEDRLVFYDSQTKRYLDEPGRALLSRLRFDPWKKLAPELSRQAPPTLTPEQRARFKAELVALTAPIQRSIQKVFFRPLTEKRTFNGIEGRGYRLTQLNNTGGRRKGQQQWLRTSMEWWVSGSLPGDDVITQFRDASRAQLKGLETPTSSIWLNEYIALAKYGGNETLREAFKTLGFNQGEEAGTLSATPLQLSISVVPPPLQRAATGDIHFDLALTQRSTGTLAPTVFTAPSGYTRWNPESYLKKLDPYLNGSAIKKAYDEMLKKM